MRIGLIDTDFSNRFPNLALMKLSAYHKDKGDLVEWYSPWGERYDLVYVSKIYSFTPDYELAINSEKVIRGGSGYAISLRNGKEIYDKEKDAVLPFEIERIYPDYSLYPELTKDTAFGFLTRGCPRGCHFCIVGQKEGYCSVRVAKLSDFWRGQKNIVLCDPNLLACNEKKELLLELKETGSYVDFNQGLDARFMTEELAEILSQIKMKEVHFAWDKYREGEVVLAGLKIFKEKTKISQHKLIVYTLVNFDTTFEQDLERIYTLRELGYWPYVMIYNKKDAEHKYIDLQRWVNMRSTFAVVEKFEDYKRWK